MTIRLAVGHIVAMARGRPTEHSTSRFARWMAEMGFTNEQAATALGLSISRVKELKRGEAYNEGREGNPDTRTLLAMAALKAGLAPYSPENLQEK